MTVSMIDEATDQGVVARAQKRADKEAVPMYVGLTYTIKYYVSKKKPSEDWLITTVYPSK